MSDATGRLALEYEVSSDVARLAHLLRVAANTTRLLATAAGPKAQAMQDLASKVDDLAGEFAAIGTTHGCRHS